VFGCDRNLGFGKRYLPGGGIPHLKKKKKSPARVGSELIKIMQLIGGQFPGSAGRNERGMRKKCRFPGKMEPGEVPVELGSRGPLNGFVISSKELRFHGEISEGKQADWSEIDPQTFTANPSGATLMVRC